MRKPVLAILICFFLLQSCGAPTPPPTSAPTSTYTATITPPGTSTPTVTPSPTIVKVPTVDYNASATPPPFIFLSPTPVPGMPTFTPVPSSTPSVAGPGFEWLKTAGTQFYWGVCTPNKIKLTVQVTEPTEVFSVTLFVRMRRLKAQIFTPWNKGIGMEPVGNGMWEGIIYANSIDGHELYRKGYVWYQVVAIGANNIEVGRTHVYVDALKLEPCMCLTPPCEPEAKKP